MTDAPDSEIEFIARGMLRRYSRPTVAREMAFWHAMDHPLNSVYRRHWLRVHARICILMDAEKRRNGTF